MLKSGVVLLVLAAVLVAGSPLLGAEDASPDSLAFDTDLSAELFAKLDELPCKDLDVFAFQAVPYYVHSGKPDQLYEFTLYWEDRCGLTEPVMCMMILGSIWDGAFDEGIYDYGIIDHLIDRYDSGKISAATQQRKDFDAFTVDFADQLLPHIERRGLEEFYCLYYSGQTEVAWDLLRSSDLEDTWLRYYYDEEMAMLEKDRSVPVVMLTGGAWYPSGNMDFVGDKTLVGVLGGVRWPHWMLRGVLEVRVGRTKEPYWVNQEGYQDRSNRFDAIYLGGEFGPIVWQSPRHAVDFFLGVGGDWIRPFIEEDLALTTINGNVGVGYRAFLGSYREFVLGLDIRREWIGERNEAGTSLSGGAWSIRFGLGYSYNKSKTRRSDALGR